VQVADSAALRRPTGAVRSAGLALLLWTAPWPVHAATIYRWIDDQGKTHYSEQVPQQYQQAARPLAPGAADPTPAQRQGAQARAALDKRRAAEIGRPASQPILAPTPAVAASAPPVKRPAHAPNADTSCETWARLYQESLDCFGPYRTTRGATRPEAFDHCTPVDEPASRCRQTLPD